MELFGARVSVTLPGFENDLPDGVFVRGVPGGSLEQITLYLGVLHALKHLGLTVYNSGQAIERTVDKANEPFDSISLRMCPFASRSYIFV